jgi:hypothetical protein
MKFATMLAVLSMVSAGVVSAEARATTIRCDGCSSAEMQEWAIMETAQNGYTYDEVFVINQTENFMKKYIVTVAAGGGDIPDQIPDGSTGYGTATEVPVPAPELQYFSAAIMVNGQIVALAQGLPGSMYDVVNNPSADHALAEFARNTPEANTNGFLAALAGLRESKFDFGKVTITIQLVASDNSKAIMVFDPNTKTWRRQTDETRDSSGNIIPPNKVDITGGVGNIRQYSFANDYDYSRFVQHASYLGAVFVGPIGSVGAGGGIVCTSIIKSTEGGESREETQCSSSN